jgi:hypothetical protein
LDAVSNIVGLSLRIHRDFDIDFSIFTQYIDYETSRLAQVLDIQAKRYPHLFG